MIAPPVMSPRTNGAWSSESLSTLAARPLVSAMIMEKIIVVAPTTAVPIKTGFAVALNVLPAPSLASSMCLARSEEHTSELQSQSNLVCRLLLEKKKKIKGAIIAQGPILLDCNVQ